MVDLLSPSDKSMIDDLMGAAIPTIVAFDWFSMSRWRTKKGVASGVLGVELCHRPQAEATPEAIRFTPYPPRLVLAVDNGVVVFEDGRRVPAERAETFVSADAGRG